MTDFGRQLQKKQKSDVQEVRDYVEKLQKRNSILSLFIGLTVFSTAAILLYISYLIFAPIKVLEIKDVDVEPKPVYAGQEVSILLDYCKSQNINANVTITYDGEPALPTFGTAIRLPVGCHNDFKIPVIVPLSTPAGPRSMTIKHVYRTNPLHIEEVTYQTPQFRVLPPIQGSLFAE
jgi:hypothetical protein